MTSSRQAVRRSAVMAQAERDRVAEAALAKIAAISSIPDSSTIGIAICDRALRCAVANRFFAFLRGAQAENHADKSILEVFGADTGQLEAAFQRVWKNGKPVSDIEMRAAFPGKTENIFLTVNLRPIKDVFGAICYVAAIFFDSTAKKKLERRLKDLLASADVKQTAKAQRGMDEYAEIPAESARTLRRGIEMFTCSMVVRNHLSEIRIAQALGSGPLFLAIEHDGEKHYREALLRMVSVGNPHSEIERAAGAPIDTKAPSPRERQIVQLLVEGKANKEIAEILALSTRTVEGYCAKLMEKLDLHSVGELVRYAFRHHIVEV